MNIKILDSWLKEYVKTTAKPQKIAELLSLASVSVERLEKYNEDYVYDIEITTNRPDLMSILGLARETAAVLNQNGISATFTPPALSVIPAKAGIQKRTGSPIGVGDDNVKLTIHTNEKLTNRVMAVVMEVTVKPSPELIKNRLEATDIRSLSNLIDVTNYVMRVIGHPTHVFDYDRLATKSLTIRGAKKGEKIETLDKKIHTLRDGDIIAVDDSGRIIDLLAIMGLENSVVTNETKRILFFIDNNDAQQIRKTSMGLGIRSEAAVLNEKGVDPELATDAFAYGVKLFEEVADGKIISEIIDTYSNKPQIQTVSVTEEQIASVMGVPVTVNESAHIMQSLGFATKISSHVILASDKRTRPESKKDAGQASMTKNILTVTPPSFRAKDITIPEDVIEEIARIYGYQNIPDKLPAVEQAAPTAYGKNEFFWEDRVKDMLKYWGFTEVYTYPMVPKELYDGKIEDAVTIENPLSEEFVVMRRTLTPSLLKVIKENKKYDTVHIFEIANVYVKKAHALPEEKLTLAGVVKCSD